MKKILYQNSKKRYSLALFIVLMPLMALRGGGQAKGSNIPEKIILKRQNEIVREEIDKYNDTIRFIDAWQRYKDSVDRMKEIHDTSNKK